MHTTGIMRMQNAVIEVSGGDKDLIISSRKQICDWKEQSKCLTAFGVNLDMRESYLSGTDVQ